MELKIKGVFHPKWSFNLIYFWLEIKIIKKSPNNIRKELCLGCSLAREDVKQEWANMSKPALNSFLLFPDLLFFWCILPTHANMTFFIINVVLLLKHGEGVFFWFKVEKYI